MYPHHLSNSHESNTHVNPSDAGYYPTHNVPTLHSHSGRTHPNSERPQRPSSAYYYSQPNTSHQNNNDNDNNAPVQLHRQPIPQSVSVNGASRPPIPYSPSNAHSNYHPTVSHPATLNQYSSTALTTNGVPNRAPHHIQHYTHYYSTTNNSYVNYQHYTPSRKYLRTDNPHSDFYTHRSHTSAAYAYAEKRHSYQRHPSSQQQISQYTSHSKQHGERGEESHSEYHRRNSHPVTLPVFHRQWTHIEQPRVGSVPGDHTSHSNTLPNSITTPSTSSDNPSANSLSSSIPRKSIQFTLVSYNVLCSEYIERSFFPHHPAHLLHAKYRHAQVLAELQAHNADIICLQEIDLSAYKYFTSQLAPLGYQCLYKPRTNKDLRRADGSMIFYKSDKFQCVTYTDIEYVHYPIAGARDNIAILALLKVIQPFNATAKHNDEYLCVANTHILYNPKCGDIKLGQFQILTNRIDEWLSCMYNQSQNNTHTSHLTHNSESNSNNDVKMDPGNTVHSKYSPSVRQFLQSTAGHVLQQPFSTSVVGNADILNNTVTAANTSDHNIDAQNKKQNKKKRAGGSPARLFSIPPQHILHPTDRVHILLQGDFNCTPESLLIQFMTQQFVNYRNTQVGSVDGQFHHNHRDHMLLTVAQSYSINQAAVAEGLKAKNEHQIAIQQGDKSSVVQPSAPAVTTTSSATDTRSAKPIKQKKSKKSKNDYISHLVPIHPLDSEQYVHHSLSLCPALPDPHMRIPTGLQSTHATQTSTDKQTLESNTAASHAITTSAAVSIASTDSGTNTVVNVDINIGVDKSIEVDSDKYALVDQHGVPVKYRPTSFHHRFKGTLDYIFYSPHKYQPYHSESTIASQSASLELTDIYDLPSFQSLKEGDMGLPTETLGTLNMFMGALDGFNTPFALELYILPLCVTGSDHFCLAARFRLWTQ